MVDKPTGGFGSFLDLLWNSLSGHGYMDGSTWETPEYLGQRPQMQPDGPPSPQPSVPLPPRRPSHFGHPAMQPQQAPQIPLPPRRPGFMDVIQIPGSQPMVPQGFNPANLGSIDQPMGSMMGLRAYGKRHPLSGA